ncbi:MAG: hypothetical protein ACRD90_05560 [Nitrosopumilaceae archaeon]
MNYQSLHRKIMNMSPAIRFATICDTNGRVKYSGHRKGVKNLLTPSESRNSLRLAVMAWKIRSKLSRKIGKGKYVLAEYAKIKRITMPLGNKHLLYLTTSRGADHAKILNRIVRLRP